MITTPNIALAGLTAAGKTTHGLALAADLGFGYVSATEILLEILGIGQASEALWFDHLEEIHNARADGTVDAELEARLVDLAATSEGIVFDTWALAWIGRGPLVRIWIESDLDSRIRKCLVSQGAVRSTSADARILLQDKDDFNRRLFRDRHNFDLFTDRHRYDAVLHNGHLIPVASEAAAKAGIETFAPVVKAAVDAIVTRDAAAAARLCAEDPIAVHRITIP
jgi:cytidylate kinase